MATGRAMPGSGGARGLLPVDAISIRSYQAHATSSIAPERFYGPSSNSKADAGASNGEPVGSELSLPVSPRSMKGGKVKRGPRARLAGLQGPMLVPRMWTKNMLTPDGTPGKLAQAHAWKQEIAELSAMAKEIAAHEAAVAAISLQAPHAAEPQPRVMLRPTPASYRAPPPASSRTLPHGSAMDFDAQANELRVDLTLVAQKMDPGTAAGQPPARSPSGTRGRKLQQLYQRPAAAAGLLVDPAMKLGTLGPVSKPITPALPALDATEDTGRAMLRLDAHAVGETTLAAVTPRRYSFRPSHVSTIYEEGPVLSALPVRRLPLTAEMVFGGGLLREAGLDKEELRSLKPLHEPVSGDSFTPKKRRDPVGVFAQLDKKK